MDPKKKYNLFKENKNFCAMPWNGFEVYPTGQIKTCSMGQTYLGNLHQQKIGDILRSDKMKKIKQRRKVQHGNRRTKNLETLEELKCVDMWAELTNVGLGVATTLKKQVVDIDLVTKVDSLAGKFHTKE